MAEIIEKSQENAQIITRHEAYRRFSLLRKTMLKKNRHQDNAGATTVIGHRYTRALNSGGKMKICKKLQTFELIG